MSARDRLPFGSGDDAARAAAAPALDALRTELLVMPRDEVVENHVDMMAFEQQLLATPRFAKTRATMPRPRRVAFVVRCRVRDARQLWAERRRCTPGSRCNTSPNRSRGRSACPNRDHTAPTPHAAAAGPKPTTSRPQRGPSRHAAPDDTPLGVERRADDDQARHEGRRQGRRRATAHTRSRSCNRPDPTPTPVAKAGPTAPSKRIKPRKPGHKPSNDSTNTPAGYPNDWRKLAAAATTAQLQVCAQADTLDPADCPQVATAAGADAACRRCNGRSLNDAAARCGRRSHDAHPVAGKTGPATTVYGLRAVPDGRLLHRGRRDRDLPRVQQRDRGGDDDLERLGVRQRDASAAGRPTGHLLPGVTVPPFERPAAASDGAVACAGSRLHAPDSRRPADCADPTSGQLTGDPTQGAVVTFDDHQGDLHRHRARTPCTATDGTAASAPYTATLFFDGQNFQIARASPDPDLRSSSAGRYPEPASSDAGAGAAGAGGGSPTGDGQLTGPVLAVALVRREDRRSGRSRAAPRTTRPARPRSTPPAGARASRSTRTADATRAGTSR